MASPQLQDGYTPLANDLLEAMILADFNRREWRLVMAVARATYGWSKKTTALPKLQLIKRAGLDPSDGYKILKGLKDRQVLIETEKGIGIQKDHDLWQSRTRGRSPLGANHPYQGQITPTELGKSPIVTRGKSHLLKSCERPSGADSRTPKSISKTNTKSNIADAPLASALKGRKGPRTHAETDASIQLFIEQFSRKFEGRTYQVEWGRDRKLISELLSGHGPEVVRELIPLFFRYAPRWVKENGHYTITAFRKTFNDLQALRGRGDI